MNRSLKNELIQLLFPSDIKCIVCGKEISPKRYGLCSDCKLSLNDNFCVRCGRHKVGIGDYCGECSEIPLYFDEARSAVDYDGNAVDIVRRLKYGNARYLVEPMSEYLLDVLLMSDWQAKCITFVPTERSRRRKRGYNQAELLAKSLSARIDLPYVTLLEKVKKTVNQAKLYRSARMENLKDSFVAVGKPPDHIILIDDVMTTGSTLNECAKTLKKAGAKIVYALTFASVPERPFLDNDAQNIAEFRR